MSKREKKFFDSPAAIFILPVLIGLIGIAGLGIDKKPRNPDQQVMHRLEK